MSNPEAAEINLVGKVKWNTDQTEVFVGIYSRPVSKLPFNESLLLWFMILEFRITQSFSNVLNIAEAKLCLCSRGPLSD